MTECIRPALYQAYHQLTLARKTDEIDSKMYKVVGPVCESADFLNKAAQLPNEIHKNQLVILWDVGAYCHVLSSNYNMRPRRAEFLVNGCEFRKSSLFSYTFCKKEYTQINFLKGKSVDRTRLRT